MQLRHELLDATNARICADGCLVAEVRAARAGIQTYNRNEVNAPVGFAGDVVRVYRPEDEVFSRDSMASFAAAPVTIDHPSEAVTADNWRRLGVGEINGDVARDGEFVRVPIIVRDASAVDTIMRSHKQLSMGYSVDLDWTPGKSPSGEAYDAVQRHIRINHIAAVPAARGGPQLRIIDERKQKEPAMPGIIVVDGLPVSLADEAAVRAVVEKKDAAIAQGVSALADANGKLSEANGKVAALEKQVADAKAELEPAALDKRVADRAALVAKAKVVKADIATDGKTDAEIRKAVVAASLGDEALAAMDDGAIAGAFAVIAKDAKPADPLRAAMRAPAPIVADPNRSVRDLARAMQFN